MKLFRAVVLDAWAERESEARGLRERHESRVKTLQERLELLEDAFIYRRAIDQETFDRQRDKLREELALAEIDV
jgi:hypothetical protein